ncbi:hypothetical protein LINPERHAP1_LOCUS6837, partial [Linum perenne]
RDRDYKPNSSGGGGQSQEQTLFCRYCKKTSHNIEDCLKLKYKRKMERERAGGNTGGFRRTVNSASYTGQQEEPSFNQGSAEHNGTLRFSSEDCSRLMALLQQNSNTVSSPNDSPQANSTRTTPAPIYPNFAGPSQSDDDWFCKRS